MKKAFESNLLQDPFVICIAGNSMLQQVLLLHLTRLYHRREVLLIALDAMHTSTKEKSASP